MYNEARGILGQAANMGSEAAMINLGNLAMLERDIDAAERWYTQALSRDPANRAAANGLNQIAIDRMD
ncbi:MAG: hypothetical protein LBJ90_04445 [Treponema sp.]|jgi:TPR repeat protein|nr:hypothetical protein [Treponema sp.]